MEWMFNLTNLTNQEMDCNVRELLSGVIIVITDHKTGIKGPAEVWVNPTDQLKLRAFREVNACYAEQTGKAYPPDSPLFVNHDMNPWRSIVQ